MKQPRPSLQLLSLPLLLTLASCQTAQSMTGGVARVMTTTVPSMALAPEMTAPLPGKGHLIVSLSQLQGVMARQVLAAFSDIERLEVRLAGTGSGPSSGHTTSHTFNKADLTSRDAYHTFVNLPAGNYDLVIEAFDTAGQSIGKATYKPLVTAGNATTVKAQLKLVPTVVAAPVASAPSGGNGTIPPTGALNTEIAIEDGPTLYATNVEQTVTLADTPAHLCADAIGNVWVASTDPDPATSVAMSQLIKVASDGSLTGRFAVGERALYRPSVDRAGSVWVSGATSVRKFSSAGASLGVLAGVKPHGVVAHDSKGLAFFKPMSSAMITSVTSDLTPQPPVGNNVSYNGLAVDGQDRVWLLNAQQLVRMTQFSTPIATVTLPSGYLSLGTLVVDSANNAWARLYKLNMVSPMEQYEQNRLLKIGPSGDTLQDIDLGTGRGPMEGFVLSPDGDLWAIQQNHQHAGPTMTTAYLSRHSAAGGSEERYQVPAGVHLRDLAFDAGGRLWAADQTGKKLYRFSY